MISLGKKHILTITQNTPEGIYLDGGEHGEILLTDRGDTSRLVEGDTIEVFLFREQGQIVATRTTPKAMVDEFAVLRVVGLNEAIGAFLDWGLHKDLLLPVREMENQVAIGDDVVVYLFHDPVSGRILATARLSDRLDPSIPTYKPGQPVSLIIVRETPLGFVALIEKAHEGLIYHSTLHEPLLPGQELTGYIGPVRTDGKIDLTLDSSGHHKVKSLTDDILAALRRNGGMIQLDDDSSPDEIRLAFGASKKAFKQALGSLFKQRLIRFNHPGVELVNKTQAPPPRR